MTNIGILLVGEAIATFIDDTQVIINLPDGKPVAWVDVRNRLITVRRGYSFLLTDLVIDFPKYKNYDICVVNNMPRFEIQAIFKYPSMSC